MRFSPVLFVVMTVIEVFSLLFPLIPYVWYANCISCLNLACGVLGIVFLLKHHPQSHALLLVFLGQVLDLFDGRAAEKFGSTPQGELFDDIADATSFGLCIGLMNGLSFHSKFLGYPMAVIYGAMVFARLIRFVIEKRKQGQKGGVAVFSGLPSPAAALIVGSSSIVFSPLTLGHLFPNASPTMPLFLDLIKASVSLFVSILMMSRVQYPHFGR
ncbi:CDP-alcohol phosphatidyltransferase like protein, partial [Aduncisulcus paluster]